MIALEQIRQLPLREEQDLEVPQWHKEMLDERERLVAEGKAQFLDWDEARRQIDEATR